MEYLIYPGIEIDEQTLRRIINWTRLVDWQFLHKEESCKKQHFKSEWRVHMFLGTRWKALKWMGMYTVCVCVVCVLCCNASPLSDSQKQPGPEGTARTVVIQERRLHVGVHNGWCFLDKPQVAVLEPLASGSRGRSTLGKDRWAEEARFHVGYGAIFCSPNTQMCRNNFPSAYFYRIFHQPHPARVLLLA